uniref:LRRNT domain-containing protein n=1 Tax=Stegastes partitus TaxID=144197 RepID=A0A3B4Z138_9TELE
MDREWTLTLLLQLLLCHTGSTDLQTSCPYRCQCFTPGQVLCADERMTSLPNNISRQLIFINNAIRSINAQAFEHLTELQELDISGNPWLEHLCDCHMWYLHDWVLRNSRDIEMLDRMLCEGPNFLKKQTVVSIDRDQLVCQVSKDELPDVSAYPWMEAKLVLLTKLGTADLIMVIF